MADEKAVEGDTVIPPPVIAARPDDFRRRRYRFKLATLLLVFWAYLWYLQTHGIIAQLKGYFSIREHEVAEKPLIGKAAEKLFLSVPDTNSCIAASRLYASKPHIAGSTGDLDTAKEFLYLLDRELGIISSRSEDPIFPAGSPESRNAILSIPHTHAPRAWIDVYYPVMNTPLERALQVLDADGNVIWDADLKENADDTDPLAGEYSDAVPTFHGLSKDGDVTGRLIYANYGRKEDYDDLVAKGVNFTGAIVLTRYGAIFRGLKIKGAQELGAVGVLIYSDPRDDGMVTVENGYEPYPHGPARNADSVQRGSVQFLSMYPGDPTTPGYPSYPNATRTEGENIPRIPSLPISWANAKTLMEKIKEGETVRLMNHVDDRVIPIWNTMAVIPGYIKDEVIVIGNHRDAWVMGAADPTSGTASIVETIRGFGALMKNGWKPLRTIIIASWDAEEYGLIGSTEWGEDFADWIDNYVVAYLNLDGSVSGSRFSSSASPLLAHVVQQTATEIPHPTDPDRTLWDATSDVGPYFGMATNDNVTLNGDAYVAWEAQQANVDELGVGVLGSGSDFTVFLQRLGVASMSHGFGGTPSDPVYHYHSVYDSERWMELYGDPGFNRHVAVAKHLGLLTLRISDSVVLPLNTTHYTYELEYYLKKIQDIVSAQSFEVDLSPLRKSIHALQAASKSLDFEKLVAERQLKKEFKKIHKKLSKLRKLRRKLAKKAWKAYCKIQKMLGRKCKKPHHHPHSMAHDDGHPGLHSSLMERRVKPRIGHAGELAREKMRKEMDIVHGIALKSGFGSFPERHHPRYHHHEHSSCSKGGAANSGYHHHPHLPLDGLKKAVAKIRAVNQKLVAFERGFISEDGIPEREWYKHLGVAPGKWLGYGATTLPALTEAITIEKNSTLAESEVGRLKALVDALADKIRVHG